MKNKLLKNIKKNKFRYFLIPLILLIISAVFFTLSYIEVINSPNTNSGDVGFGYAASGIIFLILAVMVSAILSIIFIYKKK